MKSLNTTTLRRACFDTLNKRAISALTRTQSTASARSAAGLLGVLLALGSTAASAATLAITGGTLCTGVAGSHCAPGTVIVTDGRITSVGNGKIPSGAQVIDAAGKYVTPGLIDGFSRLGLIEIEGVDSANSASAAKAHFAAAFDVVPAIDPDDKAVSISRVAGITSAIVAPEARATLAGGYGAVLNTGSTTRPIRLAHAFEYVELGEDGAELAGGSRGASFVALSNALDEAQRYAANLKRYQAGAWRDALTNRLDTEALVPVVNGTVPLLVHAESVKDIHNMLRLKERFKQLRLILVGAAEGWQIAPELAAAHVPVVMHALQNLPESFEKLSATMANAARLKHAGVLVAIGSGPGDFDGQQSRLLPQVAGNLLGLLPPDNLSADEILEMITSAPARAFNIADEVGSLERGKRADIVLWDGPPLELSSAPTLVMIDGQPTSLVTRQTLLRDRYKDIAGRNGPPQYPRSTP